MRMVLALVFVVIALAIAGYAHVRLARQVQANPTQRWLGHMLLVVVGAAFGWAVSTVYMAGEDGGQLAAFLTAFGVAHTPPAIVLWLKKQQ